MKLTEIERYQRLGTEIRRLRRANDESQTELALALGIKAHSLITRYETAQEKVPTERLALLAKHYGVTVDYFMDIMDGNAPKQSKYKEGELEEKIIELLEILIAERRGTNQ